MSRIFCLASILCLAQSALAAPPEILSIFPIGVQRGTTTEIRVHGKHLDGVYAVWFEDVDLKATVGKPEADNSEVPVNTRRSDAEDQTPRQKVVVHLEVDPDTTTGKRSLRLVGPGGVSKAVELLVRSDASVAETTGDHGTASSAQAVTVPLLLDGSLARMGEVDYYSFEAAAGQEVIIHATSNTPSNSGSFDALQFTLYEPAGSWFDSERPNRLAFSDVPRLIYRFDKRGRYLLALTGFMGIGGPDFSYQLRIHSNDETHFEQLQTSTIDALQQTFRRKLGTDRVQQLLARTVYPPPRTTKSDGAAAQNAAAESASKGGAQTTPPVQEFTVPVVFEGVLDSPGKVDKYPFKAKAGQQIAFELETPELSLPEFTPRIAVLDAKGEEIMTNIWRRVGGDNNQWMKTLQPKTVFSFDKEGDYVLEVRNLVVYLYGDKGFRYRLMMRPQVPHVGKIELKEDRINLVAGQAEKLNFTSDQEEGYTGDIALALENLPPGVQALPAAEVEPEPLPKLDEGRKEQFVPKKQKLAILLVAAPDAPVTTLPYSVRVNVRPVMGKQLGAVLPVRNIPVMVLKRNSE